MSKEVIEEFTNHNFPWDFYGNYYSPLDDGRENDKGYQNNFFVFEVEDLE
jgi:hypothetical protein